MSLQKKIYLGSIAGYILFAILGIGFLKDLAFYTCLTLTLYYVVRATRKILRKFLWRIRRKLILSYIFIGFIPLCLLASILFLAFWIFMGQATTEMFNSALDSYLIQTKTEARKLLHLVHSTDRERAVEIWQDDLSADDREWMEQGGITLFTDEGVEHLFGEGPEELPKWMGSRDFFGLVLRDERLWLASVQHDRNGSDAVLMEIPVNAKILGLIGKKIGANISYVTGGKGVKDEFDETVGRQTRDPIWPVWWDVPVAWISLPDQLKWESGDKIALQFLDNDENKKGSDDEEEDGHKKVNVEADHKGKGIVIEKNGKDVGLGAFAVTTNVSRIYDHIFSRSTMLQKFVYLLMAGIAVFFLIIELISFVFGFLLAKSITASVHNLAEGTERIKNGDLTYRIRVGAQDQLGDLANQFNSMTDSIQNLLVVRAEKERLAEALQIARQMQQNLLPKSFQSPSGMEMSAMNLPAEEVCGDYYDILRKSDHETGIIIADVSGKGPSAALYMAEVKGVMLSMSQSAGTPRNILVEANRILAPTLDSRNFITMTCAMIDDQQRVMKLSRAGHNPILHFCASTGKIEVVQPRGIALGMGKNGTFEQALEEVQRELCSGDVLVFYTDGLTEAMNDQNSLYGMDRVSQIVLKKQSASAEIIKSAILQDLQEFLNGKPPQDDVTVVLLKIQ